MTTVLNKNAANTVYLTLTEKATLSTPYFLFNLIDDQSKREYNFICSDLSTATTRYNQFCIYETGSTFQNLTASTVNLGNNQSWYTYKVYEQSSSTNLIPASATTLLETGYFFLSAATPEVSVNQYSNSISIKSFK